MARTFCSHEDGGRPTRQLLHHDGRLTAPSVHVCEAYLNHLGNLKFSFWAEIESIKVMDKFAVLCKYLGLSLDFSRRPYQTLGSLLKFRNAIAHGRSQVLEETKDVSSQDDPHSHIPKAHWEEYCTLANAQRAKEDVSQVIKELHIAAGLGDYPFVHGVGMASVSLRAAQPVDAPDR